MPVHLTPSMVNDRATLCGVPLGEGMTQLLWYFKIDPVADCRRCLAVYRSAQPAFDAFLRLPTCPPFG